LRPGTHRSKKPKANYARDAKPWHLALAVPASHERRASNRPATEDLLQRDARRGRLTQIPDSSHCKLCRLGGRRLISKRVNLLVARIRQILVVLARHERGRLCERLAMARSRTGHQPDGSLGMAVSLVRSRLAARALLRLFATVWPGTRHWTAAAVAAAFDGSGLATTRHGPQHGCGRQANCQQRDAQSLCQTAKHR
jgi:hypothetical protein